MTVLADGAIRTAHWREHFAITPWDDSRVQPASYDLALGSEFIQYDRPGRIGHWAMIDPAADNSGEMVKFSDEGEGIIMPPGAFLLAGTREVVRLGRTLAASVNGKSSLARLGLSVHQTAGWIDPGFEGAITLELVNHSPRPFKLWPGMLIAQLVLHPIEGDVMAPYGSGAHGSRYQGQGAPQASRSWQGFVSDAHPAPPVEVFGMADREAARYGE